MDEAEELARLIGMSGTKILLWIAIGLGLVFIGVLIFDHLRRKRRRHRYRTRPKGLGRTLTKPFRRVRAFWHALKELRRQRVRRRQWDEPRRQRTPNGARELRTRRRFRPS
jgi:hypothetical protein